MGMLGGRSTLKPVPAVFSHGPSRTQAGGQTCTQTHKLTRVLTFLIKEGNKWMHNICSKHIKIKRHFAHTHARHSRVDPRPGDGEWWQSAFVMPRCMHRPRGLCGQTHHWLLQDFGRAPRVVSCMVAPSLQPPNIHTRLLQCDIMLKILKRPSLFYCIFLFSVPNREK